jgi:hypothetical protein
MSRETRAIRRRIEKSARKTALAAVKREGCTCRPKFRGSTRWVDGAIPRLTLAHDASCILLRSHEGASLSEPSSLVLSYDPAIAGLQLRLLEGDGA